MKVDKEINKNRRVNINNRSVRSTMLWLFIIIIIIMIIIA